jgi:hypothetical protein
MLNVGKAKTRRDSRRDTVKNETMKRKNGKMAVSKRQTVTNVKRPAPVPQRATRPEARQETREVAVREVASAPAHLMSRMAEDAGKGVSKDQADNLVPLIYVLQANSPQCMPGHQSRIEGAGPGMIWLRNAPSELELVEGEEGFVFQPCYFTKDWVEWMPDRGGFVGRHADRPAVAQLEDIEGDDGQTRQVWVMPNQNRVVETRYHIGFVFIDNKRLPYTIPLSSTGHSVSKAWMFSMNQEQMPDGGTAPSFALLYRLRTSLRQKNNNSWYQFTVEKEGWVQTVEDYERGLALHDAFVTGAKRVAEETDEVSGVRSSGEDDSKI